MNAKQIVEIMGGRRQVMQITGLSKGRISQWISQGHIPRPWLVAFEERKPGQICSLVPDLPRSARDEKASPTANGLAA